MKAESKYYSYKAITEDRSYKRGFVRATNKFDAINEVKKEKGILTVVSVKPEKGSSSTQNFKRKFYSQLDNFENNMHNKMQAGARKREEKARQKRLKKEKDKAEGKDLSSKSPILKAVNKMMKDIKRKNDSYKSDASQISRGKLEADFIFRDVQEYEKKSIEKEETKLDISILEKEETEEMKENRKIKVKEKELTMFTRRLQIMISSGMSLLNSLLALQETTSDNLSKVIASVTEDIQRGTSFSEALAKFPRQFDSTYVALVSIGESSGSLDKSLKDIIRVRDQQAKINNKMRVASMYPIVIGLVLVALMAGAFLFFLPQFEEMYAEQDLDMPLFSRVVFGIAGVFPLIALGAVALIIAFLYLKSKSPLVDFFYRKHRDKFLLRAPVVSKLMGASYMYTFSSTVSLMLSNGIRLSDTLELTKRTIDNVYMKGEIEDVSARMVHGESFAEALMKQEYFDDVLVNIANTGEKTGKMVHSLEEVSKFYNDELRRQVDSMLELVQPVSILLIGLVLAPIIIAAYLPILEVSSGGVSGLN